MLPHRQNRVKKDTERSSRIFGEGTSNTRPYCGSGRWLCRDADLSEHCGTPMVPALPWPPFWTPRSSLTGWTPCVSSRIAKRSIELSEPYSQTCRFDVQFHGTIHSSGVGGPYAKLKADLDRIGSAWDDCGSDDEFCGSPALPARCRI
jgi:hypothetical protein